MSIVAIKSMQRAWKVCTLTTISLCSYVVHIGMLYVSIITIISIGEERRLREAISSIRVKVNEECDLVSKGKLMIKKKEATKESKKSLKERREVDEACNRARSKLEVIEKDIAEMEDEIAEINTEL